VHAGKRGKQRVVRVDVTVAERAQERGADKLEEAGGDHQVGLVLGDVPGERGVPLLARRVGADGVDEGRHSRRRGPVEARDAVSVGADRDHPRPVCRVGGGVEQGLQVAA
jgi:hypothetical protein